MKPIVLVRAAALAAALAPAGAFATPPYTGTRLTGLVLAQPAAPVKINYCVGYAGDYTSHVSANASFTNRTPLIITQIQFRYEIVGQDYEPVDVHHVVWNGYLSPGARVDPKYFLVGYKPMAKWFPGTDPTNFIRCSIERTSFSDSRQWYAAPTDLQAWSPFGDVLFHRRVNSTLP